MSGSYHGIFQALGSIDRQLNIFTGQAVSSTTTFASTVMGAHGMMLNASYQCGVATGTPTGTFNVYVSNDPRAGDPNTTGVAFWTLAQSVGFTAGVTTVGSQTSTTIVIQNGTRYSYCAWINATGSGTVYAFGCGTST